MTFTGRLYNFIFENDNADGSVLKYWPFGGAAYPLWMVTIAYMLFVFRIGPRLMQNRPAFKLRGVLFVYNVVQILMNFALFSISTFMIYTRREVYDMGCMGRLPASDRHKTLEAILIYLYFLLKIVDYCDTIFFVLRKSFKQVTFLHVYHHWLMAVSAHSYLRYYGQGGHVIFIGVLNSLVHAIMYSYYLLSSVRPNVAKVLWWKKYITIIQLLQFVILLIQQAWPIVMRPDCEFPRIWSYMAVIQALFMIYLFGNFYIKNYMRAPKTPAKTQ